MSRFLFTLQPVDNFFFGGEISFRPGIDANDRKSSYLVKSNKFPQQTTILGMLRKEILIKTGDFSEDWNYEDKHKINTLIGNESFKIDSDEKRDFGKIKAISPVFLLNDKEIYVTAPLNHIKTKNSYESFKLADEVDTCFGKLKLPNKEHYKSKDGLFHGFMNAKTGKMVEEDVFYIIDTRIGIEISEKGGAEEGKFYKTIGYKMYEKCCFGFYADIDDIDFHGYKNSVFIGSDGLGFILRAERSDDYLENIVDLSRERDFIVLLSDTYLPKDGYELCTYAVSETIDFRNVRTSNQSGRLTRIGQRYSLLKRGSVLYSDHMDSLKAHIDKQRNMVQIGYNIYI